MSGELLNVLLIGLGETVYMTVLSTLFAVALGLPMGVALVVTEKNHILEYPSLNKVIGTFINITRSFPFIILIVVLLPLSRFLVGTTLGASAAVVPLAIGAAPFVARIIENCLKEVEKGKIEAALSMGATTGEIVWKMLIPEALSSLVRGITLSIITIAGFTATAGAIGAGGLGSLAIRYGYLRYQTDVLIWTVIILIVLVQGIQWIGNLIANGIDRKCHKFG